MELRHVPIWMVENSRLVQGFETKKRANCILAIATGILNDSLVYNAPKEWAQQSSKGVLNINRINPNSVNVLLIYIPIMRRTNIYKNRHLIVLRCKVTLQETNISLVLRKLAITMQWSFHWPLLQKHRVSQRNIKITSNLTEIMSHFDKNNV